MLSIKHNVIIDAQHNNNALSLALPAAVNNMTTKTFKGTRNTLVTDARKLLGTNSPRKTAIAGQYTPKPNSKAQNANNATK